MAQLQSPSTSDLATVDSSLKSLRTIIKPDQQWGSYNLSAASGALTGIAANAPVFSFRWASGVGQLCVIKRVAVNFVCTTGFTAGQSMGYNIVVARNFLASDTVGTAVAVGYTQNNKNRTSLYNSTVTDVRISAAAALTAGTRTLDANALGSTYFYVPTTTAGTMLTNTNLISYNLNDYPLILQNNEGFIITNALLMGAAGVGTLTVNVEWFETDGYRDN
jgi:hypothetical protein